MTAGFSITLAFIIGLSNLVYSMAGKIENVPIKPASKLAIPDGEFLHYSQTIRSEIISDSYFVTKTDLRADGEHVIKIYEQEINPDKESLPDHYTNYKTTFTVSIEKASLLESEGNIITNQSQGNGVAGFKGMFYWHYQFNPVTGTLSYETKFWDGYEMKNMAYRMKSKPEYPHWDRISGALFAVRFLDIMNPGIMYMVVPEILKEPMPVSFRCLSRETIVTKAGSFKTVKVGMIAADPFISQLMSPFTKELFFWIEDSERRLIVKFQNPVSVMELDEISNVK